MENNDEELRRLVAKWQPWGGDDRTAIQHFRHRGAAQHFRHHTDHTLLITGIVMLCLLIAALVNSGFLGSP
jgi:hypothetical protein